MLRNINGVEMRPALAGKSEARCGKVAQSGGLVCVVPVLMACLFFPGLAPAASLTAEVLVQSSDCTPCAQGTKVGAIGPVLVGPVIGSLNQADIALNWNVFARADYSTLEAEAVETLVLPEGGQRLASASASAILNDTLHTSGYGSGSGFLQITSLFGGVFDGFGAGVSGGLSGTGAGTCAIKDEDIVQFCSIVVPASDNTPIDIQLVLDAFVSLDVIGGPGNGVGGGSNFVHTAYISSIETLNSAMQPISGITVTSDSGFDYPAANVPEPASIYLVGAGVLIICASRRWRRPATRRGY